MDSRRPILKSVVNMHSKAGKLLFERHGKIFELESVSGLDEIMANMEGVKTVQELAKAVSWEEPELSDLVMRLHMEGVVGFCDERIELSGVQFCELHNHYCRGWLDKLAEHPIWTELTSGQACRVVAFGFIIEKYHYIEAAHEHMAIAAAYADPRIQVDLTRHFIEEFTHGDIYLKGLSSLFPRDSVVNSVPLPSTRALVNCLNELAQQDSFAYYSANEFLQKTENTDDGLGDPVEEFYVALESNYGLPPEMCNAMRAHTAADQALGHQSVFAKMCAKIETVSVDQINKYLGATRQVFEHLDYFLTGILTVYTKYPCVPRSPARLGLE